MTTDYTALFSKIKMILGDQSAIVTGKALTPYLTGFRGKNGTALAAVEPRSSTALYHLIQLLSAEKIGYVIQGANTSLKGQSTPNNDAYPVVIIKTTHLKKFKILDIPNQDDYKLLLTEPGLSVKEAESALDNIGFDLPHKIGSHDFGNTFGASSANGCGGVRVDNRDGRASTTENDNLGVISLSANGLIYNGLIKPEKVQCGKTVLDIIDQNSITLDDIILPKMDEINLFLDQLFIEKSYPIKNHRGEIIFSGDGGEGSQVIIYLMYLVRKKTIDHKTYLCVLQNEYIKDTFYKEVVLNIDKHKKDHLPILCESMNHALTSEIVNKGTGFLTAALLAAFPTFFKQYSPALMQVRNKLVSFFSSYYISLESFAGKIASRYLSPAIFKKNTFHEVVILQYANRSTCTDSIDTFEKKLHAFCTQYPDDITVLKPEKDSFSERLILQIRNAGALATLSISQREKGTLFAFDDAIMPGKMLTEYCDQLYKKLSQDYPNQVMPPLLYGHDLKQISHNDWVITRHLSADDIKSIHHIQHEIMIAIGGHPHAEHGIGDYADTDLNDIELAKLIAHRMVNDPAGIANPGGAYQKAFERAIQNEAIVKQALELIHGITQRELSHKTLLAWDDFNEDLLHAHINQSIENMLKVHS